MGFGRPGVARAVIASFVVVMILVVGFSAYYFSTVTHPLSNSPTTSVVTSTATYTTTLAISTTSIATFTASTNSTPTPTTYTTSPTTSTTTSSSESRSSSSTITPVPSWSSFRGVNYFWTTVVDPSKPQPVAPAPPVSFPQLKANGWNLIRMNMHWNEYVVNPAEYVSNMKEVAWYAEQNGIYVIWDLIHQDGTSSQYTTDGESGVGFPTFLTAPYPTEDTYWSAWWGNQTSYEGRNGWLLARQYDTQIAEAVDNYTSTLGYELINEPPMYSSSNSSSIASFNLRGMAAFNTYAASGIRSYSTKVIIYDRPYLHPDITPSCITASPSCLLTIAPRVSNIALDYHQYNNFNSTLAAEYQSFSIQNGIPVLLGEFGPCSRSNASCPTSESAVGQYIDKAISTSHSDGWAWCYWGWREGPAGPPWQDMLNSTGGQWWLDTEIVQTQMQVYGH